MKSQEKSSYKLKPMYDGIPMPGEFGTREYVSNRNLTDKKAKELIKKHPKGEGLFEILPKETEAEVLSSKVQELIGSNNAKELKKLAEEAGIEDLSGSKSDIAKRIEAKELESAE